MTGRSSAEIIGWPRPYRGDTPSVDDLLAWLTTREGHIEIGAYDRGAIVYLGWGTFDGDTLLAALEKAVLTAADRKGSA